MMKWMTVDGGNYISLKEEETSHIMRENVIKTDYITRVANAKEDTTIATKCRDGTA